MTTPDHPVMPHLSGRLLGIDYGRVRIGLALSDALGCVVHRLGFVARRSDAQAADIVAVVARREKVAGVVIGMPLHAHGAHGRSAEWVSAFMRQLATRLTFPIAAVDERYSSSEAEMNLRAAGAWPSAPGTIDAEAAAIILRRYIAGEQ